MNSSAQKAPSSRPRSSQKIKDGATSVICFRVDEGDENGSDWLSVLAIKKRQKPRKLYLPGGKPEKIRTSFGKKRDEKPLETALRELNEETGLTLSPSKLHFVSRPQKKRGSDVYYHHFYFSVLEEQTVFPVENDEVEAPFWLPVIKVAEGTTALDKHHTLEVVRALAILFWELPIGSTLNQVFRERFSLFHGGGSREAIPFFLLEGIYSFIEEMECVLKREPFREAGFKKRLEKKKLKEELLKKEN